MKKTYKVLLTDDDTLIVHVLRKVLETQGYEVFESDTAVNIFATIDKFKPDIIIMDHNMPIISGIEAIRMLKGNVHTASIPVIYFSSALDIAQLAKEAGSDAYVSKADSKKHLIKTIELLLGISNISSE